jgi:hypothetical protein
MADAERCDRSLRCLEQLCGWLAISRFPGHSSVISKISTFGRWRSSPVEAARASQPLSRTATELVAVIAGVVGGVSAAVLVAALYGVQCTPLQMYLRQLFPS